MALPIWIDYLKEVLQDAPVEEFPAVEHTEEPRPDAYELTLSERRKLFVEDLPAEPPPAKKP